MEKNVGGVLDAASYTRRQYCDRMQWSASAWRSAVRNGLPTHRVGKQTFVLGREANDWLASQPARPSP